MSNTGIYETDASLHTFRVAFIEPSGIDKNPVQLTFKQTFSVNDTMRNRKQSGDKDLRIYIHRATETGVDESVRRRSPVASGDTQALRDVVPRAAAKHAGGCNGLVILHHCPQGHLACERIPPR